MQVPNVRLTIPRMATAVLSLVLLGQAVSAKRQSVHSKIRLLLLFRQTEDRGVKRNICTLVVGCPCSMNHPNHTQFRFKTAMNMPSNLKQACNEQKIFGPDIFGLGLRSQPTTTLSVPSATFTTILGADSYAGHEQANSLSQRAVQHGTKCQTGPRQRSTGLRAARFSSFLGTELKLSPTYIAQCSWNTLRGGAASTALLSAWGYCLCGSCTASNRPRLEAQLQAAEAPRQRSLLPPAQKGAAADCPASVIHAATVGKTKFTSPACKPLQ